MIFIRAIAVGFGLSAFFMYRFYVPFISRWVLSSQVSEQGSQPHAILFNLSVSSGTLAGLAGANALYFAVYALTCLAGGFLLASFYPVFERGLVLGCLHCFSAKHRHDHTSSTRAFSNALKF
jgi:hypothetical protein